MANYDLGIFVGHGTSEKDGSFDPGAVGQGQQEHVIAEIIVDKVVNLLKATGLNVHRDEQSYKDNDTSGNTYNLKYVLSIHINSGGGTGSEFLVPVGENFFNIEQDILNGLANLGLTNRGIKSRDYDTEKFIQRFNGQKISGTDYYGELRNAWKNGVSLSILEVGFIDNVNDLKTILNNYDKIALIVATAIAKEFGKVISPPIVKPPVTNSSEFWRVCVGSFSDKANAEIRMNELKKLGYKDTFLVPYTK